MRVRYFIQLSFNGTNYSGWQVQHNASSVQQKVNEALAILLKQPTDTLGCGRTDAGVHATQFFLHFDVEKKIKDDEKFIFQLNALLPYDIAAKKMLLVASDAHARFDATLRTYHYIMHHTKNCFVNNNSVYVRHNANIELMNHAATILYKYKEYECFSKSHTQVKTFNCNIIDAKWYTHHEFTIFTISADRFLRGMVRAIVGTMWLVGEEKISLQAFEKIIKSKDRKNAGKSVPAHGLYLSGVAYPFIPCSGIILPHIIHS